MTTSTTTYEIGARLAHKANATARNRGVDPAKFVRDLAREQLLAAVGRVADEDTVALKGSALVLLDPDMGEWVRPSKDLDLHLHGVDVADLRDLLGRAAAELADVGIAIEWGACRPLWRPDGSPGGEKVKVVALLGKTRATFEVDAWVGGKRSPGMRILERPSALPGLPGVRMLAYPLEAMAADKLHAIAQFGGENTRMKDYYDLWHLSARGLDPDLLHECVETTFANNGRAVPHVPVLLPGLARSFGTAKQDAWTKMLADAQRTDMVPANFVEVVDGVRAFANRAFAPLAPRDESHVTRDSYAAPSPRMPAFA